MISYFVIVLMIFLPDISSYFMIHIPILLLLFGLAMGALLQTFLTDPGRVTVDLIEQIKLNFKLEMPHTEDSLDLDSTENDAHRENRSKLMIVNELNKLVVKYH